MKELKTVGQIIQQRYPLPRRGTKRWAVAERRKNYDQQTNNNTPTEAAYHRIINIVKTNYMQCGEVYFEREYKYDHSFGLFGMHSFITPHLYWRLDCAATYNYEITYAFNNCSYEHEIRKLMQAYPLDRTTKEKPEHPQFGALYSSVLTFQEPCFIHSFKR